MSETRNIRCHVDHCCYYKPLNDGYIISLFYIDDMLMAGLSIHEINNLKKNFSKKFKMNDLGATK